jgi:hypothetical protein
MTKVQIEKMKIRNYEKNKAMLKASEIITSEIKEIAKLMADTQDTLEKAAKYQDTANWEKSMKMYNDLFAKINAQLVTVADLAAYSAEQAIKCTEGGK